MCPWLLNITRLLKEMLPGISTPCMNRVACAKGRAPEGLCNKGQLSYIFSLAAAIIYAVKIITGALKASAPVISKFDVATESGNAVDESVIAPPINPPGKALAAFGPELP